MTQGWTTVFTGPTAEAEIARARLEARGIPVFVPGETMGPLAPIGDFGVELALEPNVQVPASAAETARRVLAESEDDGELLPGEQELPSGFFAAEPEAAVDRDSMARARTLSRCIIWSAAFPLAFPFALWNLREYLLLTDTLDPRPEFHRTTIAFGLLSPLPALTIVLWILEHQGRLGS